MPSIVGKAPDGTSAYVLAEAPITIVNDDVDRAKDRVQLLEGAAGATTHAVVIGETVTADAATLAKTATSPSPLTPREGTRFSTPQTSQEN